MKYRFFEIGQKPRDIESEQPLDQKDIEKLMKATDLSFTPLKNGNTICIDGEGEIKGLPYNPAFTEKDTNADVGYGIRGNILEGKVNEQEEFIGVE